MADDASPEDAPLTFHVKSSTGPKYTITLPGSATVLQLKEKLAGSDFADTPTERQRLIYSGRVLKDADTLADSKLKEGNTIHLVRSAASNERQNPANQGSSSGSSNATPAVPTNLSSGPGANNPLAGLTGARYAGLAHLPNQSMFGPDGGMGPPPDPEQILGLLDNPAFAASINEALQNPHVIESMMQQNPMLRGMGPEMRQMLSSPEFRRMMTDPNVLRQTIQMQRVMEGGGNPFNAGRANGDFPAPGVTDTTTGGTEGTAETQSGTQGSQQASPLPPIPGLSPELNPFWRLLNPAAAGAASPSGQANAAGAAPLDPAAAMRLMQAIYPNPNPNAQSPAGGASTGGTAGTPASGNPSNPSSRPPPGTNPFAAALQALQNIGAVGGGGTLPPIPRDLFEQPTSPRFGEGGAEAGLGWPYGLREPTVTPLDTRPPEERFADQLRQLNDMGFFEFERNVEALRRSGGSVQGAIEYLLTHQG